MGTLLSFAFYGLLFFAMMRFGCGAHMSGRHSHAGHDTKDPVK
jgi:hypothetical protein